MPTNNEWIPANFRNIVIEDPNVPPGQRYYFSRPFEGLSNHLSGEYPIELLKASDEYPIELLRASIGARAEQYRANQSGRVPLLKALQEEAAIKAAEKDLVELELYRFLTQDL